MDDKDYPATPACNCNCEDVLPTYESLQSTRLDNVTLRSSNNHTSNPTHQVLEHEPSFSKKLDDVDSSTKQLPIAFSNAKKASSHTSVGVWVCSGWNWEGKFCYSRKVEDSTRTWYQYSIKTVDRIPATGHASDFFTCMTIPSKGYNEQDVRMICQDTATALKVHRNGCSACEFRHLRGPQQACVWTNSSVSGFQFRTLMKRHDGICSCRCFDIGTHEMFTTPKSHKSPQSRIPAARSIIEHKLQLSEDLTPGKWTFNKNTLRFCDAFWTRTVKSGGEFWNQYGISQNILAPSDGKPDFFFTCKSIPRKGKDERQIRIECKGVAYFMRMHRQHDYYKCACTFESLRARKGRCPVSWHHLLRRFLAHNVVYAMDLHDKACSCGCFDVV